MRRDGERDRFVAGDAWRVDVHAIQRCHIQHHREMRPGRDGLIGRRRSAIFRCGAETMAPVTSERAPSLAMMLETVARSW